MHKLAVLAKYPRSEHNNKKKMFFAEQKLLMSSSRNSTLMAEFSCHKKKKSLRNPLIRVSPSPFSKTKTIGFAILCSSHKRERAVLGHREFPSEIFQHDLAACNTASR